jgi:conjugal transfer/entry exclusion protein
MKRSEEKKRAIKRIIDEINSPKSRLIVLLNNLESLQGTKKASKTLGNIIARLENWQNTVQRGAK